MICISNLNSKNLKINFNRENSLKIFRSEESSIDDSTSARAAKPQAPLNPFSAIFRDAFEPIFHSELHPDFFRNADEGETIFTKANEDVDEFSNKEPLGEQIA